MSFFPGLSTVESTIVDGAWAGVPIAENPYVACAPPEIETDSYIAQKPFVGFAILLKRAAEEWE